MKVGKKPVAVLNRGTGDSSHKNKYHRKTERERESERERERERNKTPILNYFVLKKFQCKIPESRKRSFADWQENMEK